MVPIIFAPKLSAVKAKGWSAKTEPYNTHFSEIFNAFVLTRFLTK